MPDHFILNTPRTRDPLEHYGRPALLLDFTRNRYRVGNAKSRAISGIPGWSFARASTGYARTSGGVLVPFASGAPRLTDKGILLEGARTNLFLRSQEFDNASWSKTGASASADQTTAPDGTTTADKMMEDGSSDQHIVTQNLGTVSNGAVYSLSIYAKQGGGSRKLSLTAYGEGYAVFDLVAGTVTQTGGHTCTIEALANGWYRCVAVITKTNTNGAFFFVLWNTSNSYAGDGASYIFVWGAQVELAPGASSYIPTTGASATRAADAASVALAPGVPATIAMEFEPSPVLTNRVLAQLDNGSDNERSALVTVPGFRADMYAGGVNQAAVSVAGALATGAIYRVAARFGANSVQCAKLAVLGTEDTSATAPSAPTTLRLGSDFAAAAPGHSYIRKLTVFAGAHRDQFLQAEST